MRSKNIEEALPAGRASVLKPLAEASTLPPEFYTSP